MVPSENASIYWNLMGLVLPQYTHPRSSAVGADGAGLLAQVASLKFHFEPQISQVLSLRLQVLSLRFQLMVLIGTDGAGLLAQVTSLKFHPVTSICFQIYARTLLHTCFGA